MEQKKTIILVSASFYKGAELFTWLKKFSTHSDENFMYWDEFAFTVNPVAECDGILILNNPSQKIMVRSFAENVLSFMMEPGIIEEHPWMFKSLNQYAKVYSPIAHSANTILSHGFMGWYLPQAYNFLSALPLPEKQFSISCIASNLAMFSGHRLRLNFVNALKKEMPQVDFFGKGSNYLPNKMDGLLPYRFSIAIENTSAPYYFTEKINDCFLAYTVPIYYGCKNIGQYFPEKSFIQLDITDPVKAIKKIRSIVEENDWEERIDALQEARQLVLNKYQPLAGAANILSQIKPGIKSAITLNPVQANWLKKLKSILTAGISKK